MEGARPRVLVAGATGYIGGGVLRALRRHGFRVRALTRDEGRLRAKGGADEVFVGHATSPGTLRGMCDGVDAVFSSIGIRGFERKPTLWDVDYQANLNVLAEAKAAGVKHFVFISVVHGAEMGKLSDIAVARERVARAAIDSGLTYTIYQPTGFFNDMAEFFVAARDWGIIPMLGDGTGRMNPMSAIDMGDEVARAIRDPRRHDRVLTVGGPETMTHQEAAELAFRVAGRRPRLARIPAWAIAGAARWARPINANAHALFKFFEFIARTPDMCGEPVGWRRVEDFYRKLAAGMSIDEAEAGDDGPGPGTAAAAAPWSVPTAAAS